MVPMFRPFLLEFLSSTRNILVWRTEELFMH